MALLLLLCLRGTPVLYQGDELGLPDTTVPHEAAAGSARARFWPHWAGRDGCRTPMPWRDAPGGGFTAPDVRPWLPLGDTGACNVEDQLADPASMVHLARDLIALRRAIRAGAPAVLPDDGGHPRRLGVEPG